MADFKLAVAQLTPLQTTIAAGVATVAVLFFWVLRLTRSTTDFPGPRGYPILGNWDIVGANHLWHKFSNWSKVYGPIYKVKILQNNWLIISNAKVAKELLDRKSSIYSSRPRMPSADIMTGGNRLSTIPYGEKWRKMRKAAHAELNASNVKQYNFVVNYQSHKLLENLIEQPDKLWTLAREFATGVVIRAVYDLDTGKANHPMVKELKSHSSTIITTFTPGQALMDLMPPLSRLPAWLWGEKASAVKVRQGTRRLNEAMRHWLEDRKSTRPVSCFLAGLIDNEEGSHLSVEEKDWLAGQLLGAGSETTAAVLQNLILAFIHYPEVQRRGQEEVDTVIGRGRPPTIEDLPSLPYVQAITKEILRWKPVARLGVPHCTSEDDVYNGHFIPKGTTIVANLYEIHQDEGIYPNASKFDPERFLNDDGTLNNLQIYAFGFGRRICVALNLAQASINAAVMNLLWGATFEAAKDASGKAVLPSVHPYDAYAGVSVTFPKPYPYVFTWRDERKKESLLDTLKAEADYNPAA